LLQIQGQRNQGDGILEIYLLKTHKTKALQGEIVNCRLAICFSFSKIWPEIHFVSGYFGTKLAEIG
jgi:hypothetical protein